jgi:hypothetical protein
VDLYPTPPKFHCKGRGFELYCGIQFLWGILRVCRFEFFDHFDFGTIDDLDHKDFVDLFPVDHAIGFQYEIIYGARIAHASVAAGFDDCITILLVKNFAQFFFRVKVVGKAS